MHEQMLPIGLLGKISCQNFKTRQFSNTAPAPWLIKESVYATMIGLNALSVWGNFKLSSSTLYSRLFLAKNAAWNAPKNYNLDSSCKTLLLPKVNQGGKAPQTKRAT